MPRSAFTMIELLVSLSVIGLLMALTIPAVQSALASARQAECRNNLKQIGIAIHVVHDAKQYFSCDNQIIFHYGMGVPGYDRTIAQVESEADQDKSYKHRCPADPSGRGGYQMSGGTKYNVNNGYLGFSDTPGIEDHRLASDFTDGFSQTIAFSENAGFTTADQLTPQDNPKLVPLWISQKMNLPGTEPQFIIMCRSPGNSPVPLYIASGHQFGYTHMFTPNTRGCWDNAPVNDPNLTAYMPTSSYHPGGVNSLFVDGHVTFVSDSIDANVWQAVGTINGNEVVGSPF